jgi:hypothetical protein
LFTTGSMPPLPVTFRAGENKVSGATSMANGTSSGERKEMS